jgi:hypothetical protein
VSYGQFCEVPSQASVFSEIDTIDVFLYQFDPLDPANTAELLTGLVTRSYTDEEEEVASFLRQSQQPQTQVNFMRQVEPCIITAWLKLNPSFGNYFICIACLTVVTSFTCFQDFPFGFAFCLNECTKTPVGHKQERRFCLLNLKIVFSSQFMHAAKFKLKIV